MDRTELARRARDLLDTSPISRNALIEASGLSVSAVQLALAPSHAETAAALPAYLRQLAAGALTVSERMTALATDLQRLADAATLRGLTRVLLQVEAPARSAPGLRAAGAEALAGAGIQAASEGDAPLLRLVLARAGQRVQGEAELLDPRRRALSARERARGTDWRALWRATAEGASAQECGDALVRAFIAAWTEANA